MYIRTTHKDKAIGIDMSKRVVDVTDALVVERRRSLSSVDPIIRIIDGVDGHYLCGISQRRPSSWFCRLAAIWNRRRNRFKWEV